MSEENEITGYTKALRMFPVVNAKSVSIPLIWENLADAARDEEVIPCCPSCSTPYRDHLGLIGTCAKLHAIYALVEANRHYTSPEAFELVCEKIMELKEDAK